jgi:hypothetical protein
MLSSVMLGCIICSAVVRTRSAHFAYGCTQKKFTYRNNNDMTFSSKYLPILAKNAILTRKLNRLESAENWHRHGTNVAARNITLKVDLTDLSSPIWQLEAYASIYDLSFVGNGTGVKFISKRYRGEIWKDDMSESQSTCFVFNCLKEITISNICHPVLMWQLYQHESIYTSTFFMVNSASKFIWSYSVLHLGLIYLSHLSLLINDEYFICAISMSWRIVAFQWAVCKNGKFFKQKGDVI